MSGPIPEGEYLVRVRMPITQKQELEDLAKKQGITLNDLMIKSVMEYIEEKRRQQA